MLGHLSGEAASSWGAGLGGPCVSCQYLQANHARLGAVPAGGREKLGARPGRARGIRLEARVLSSSISASWEPGGDRHAATAVQRPCVSWGLLQS